MEKSFIIPLYITYLTLTVIITIFVATTLFRNGKLFLIDIFHGNKELAQAVNNLLLVGFFLHKNIFCYEKDGTIQEK